VNKARRTLHSRAVISVPPPDAQRTDGRQLMAILLPEKCFWPHYDLDL